MPVKLPDPLEVARAEAQQLSTRQTPLENVTHDVLRDCPYIDAPSMFAGLEAFHQQRMARVPSREKYPESVAWVDHILAVDREVQRLARLTGRDMAILRSLGAFLTFRGFREGRMIQGTQGAAARPTMVEKCRVAYLPDSDVGQIHIKNVDDPASNWPALLPPPKELPGNTDLMDDGTGSGLHIDDEPHDIFPLEARTMLRHYANDVPGAVEFFTRYKPFWGGCNVVLRDRQKRSVAIEKCSVNFIEIFYPAADGRSHCSGMVCRDPNSPQGRYQRQKRTQYLQRYGQATDGPDQTFWDVCDRAEGMLDAELKKPGKAKFDDIARLFHTPWPQGLSKEGLKVHPDVAVEEYTLLTHATLLDKKQYIRWQRDPKSLKMPKDPETFQF